METSGHRIRCARKEKKLTQVALGKLCNVTHVTIGNWENDSEITGDNLLKLSRALDTTPEWILYGDNKQSREAKLQMYADRINEAAQHLDDDLFEDVLKYLEHIKAARALVKKYEPKGKD